MRQKGVLTLKLGNFEKCVLNLVPYLQIMDLDCPMNEMANP